jgi:hypothetical protein
MYPLKARARLLKKTRRVGLAPTRLRDSDSDTEQEMSNAEHQRWHLFLKAVVHKKTARLTVFRPHVLPRHDNQFQDPRRIVPASAGIRLRGT